MSTLVEIGCGEFAGPRFDDVDVHIAADIRRDVDYEQTTGITPLVADAAQLPLADNSANTILARNVFGDVLLGCILSKPFLNAVAARALRNEEIPANVQEELEIAAQAAYAKKLALMREAARVLIRDGRLIIVEQYTPDVAAEFFENYYQSTFQVKKTELSAVAPSNYSAHHNKLWKPQTWVATKTN